MGDEAVVFASVISSTQRTDTPASFTLISACPIFSSTGSAAKVKKMNKGLLVCANQCQPIPDANAH